MVQIQRIVEVAADMFIAQGIKSVRMDDIASQMGISKRTLYEAVGDKERLLYMTVEALAERNDKRWLEIRASSENVLDALFKIITELSKGDDAFKRMMDTLRKFYPSVYQRWRERGAVQNRIKFVKMLEQGVSEGLFNSNFNFELAVSTIQYMGWGLGNQEVQLPEDITRKEAFIQIVVTFFRGLSTPKGIEVIDRYVESINFDLAK